MAAGNAFAQAIIPKAFGHGKSYDQALKDTADALKANPTWLHMIVPDVAEPESFGYSSAVWKPNCSGVMEVNVDRFRVDCRFEVHGPVGFARSQLGERVLDRRPRLLGLLREPGTRRLA